MRRMIDESDLNGKQDKLVAGKNIKIDGNTISADGGMTPEQVAQLAENTKNITDLQNDVNHISGVDIPNLSADKADKSYVDDELKNKVSKSYVDTGLEKKQNKLIAGNNIVINGNIINAEISGEIYNAGRIAVNLKKLTPNEVLPYDYIVVSHEIEDPYFKFEFEPQVTPPSRVSLEVDYYNGIPPELFVKNEVLLDLVSVNRDVPNNPTITYTTTNEYCFRRIIGSTLEPSIKIAPHTLTFTCAWNFSGKQSWWIGADVMSIASLEPVIENANAVGILMQNMSGKQDKLTAGDNITIQGDVISATGGTKVEVNAPLIPQRTFTLSSINIDNNTSYVLPEIPEIPEIPESSVSPKANTLALRDAEGALKCASPSKNVTDFTVLNLGTAKQLLNGKQDKLTTEVWTFTLEDGSIVTKNMPIL